MHALYTEANKHSSLNIKNKKKQEAVTLFQHTQMTWKDVEADADWQAACYEDLMIITDEMYEAFYALMKCK